MRPRSLRNWAKIAVRARCDAGGPSDQPLAVGGAGQRDENALARLPWLVDPVSLPVLCETLVDPIREPQERQLA